MMNFVHNVSPTSTAPAMSEALDSLLALTGRLAEMMELGMTERGLSRSRAALLLQLLWHGPAVQRKLSQVLGVTPRYVTVLVDALEADGWVKRGPHPTDRRATIVALTEHGQKMTATMDSERQAWAEQLFGDVPPKELSAFISVIKRLETQLPHDDDIPLCPDPS
jgi:DNA-binding MarR family transcriptional regulator